MKIIDSYLRCAFEAAKSKKALDLLILDVRKLAQFTDFFILCSGTSVPQIQAISNDMVEEIQVIGTVEQIRDRLQERSKNGADVQIIYMPKGEPKEAGKLLEKLIS